MFDEALATIRAAFAGPVDYYPTEGDDPLLDLPVIWSDEAGQSFQGPGNSTRTISAEIAVDAVDRDGVAIPGRPTSNTRIVRKTVAWTVIEVVDREDVGAWVVTLEGEPL